MAVSERCANATSVTVNESIVLLGHGSKSNSMNTLSLSLSLSLGLQCSSFNPIDWRQYCCDGDLTAVVISRISRFSRAWIFCTLEHTAYTHRPTRARTHAHAHTQTRARISIHSYTHIHQSTHAHCVTSLLSCLCVLF